MSEAPARSPPLHRLTIMLVTGLSARPCRLAAPIAFQPLGGRPVITRHLVYLTKPDQREGTRRGEIVDFTINIPGRHAPSSATATRFTFLTSENIHFSEVSMRTTSNPRMARLSPPKPSTTKKKCRSRCHPPIPRGGESRNYAPTPAPLPNEGFDAQSCCEGPFGQSRSSSAKAPTSRRDLHVLETGRGQSIRELAIENGFREARSTILHERVTEPT